VNDAVVPQWDAPGAEDHLSAGQFLVKTQWAVPEDGWDAFEAADAAVEALALTLGLKGANHFRATDRSESLTVGRFESRAAYEAVLEHPEYAKVRGTMPEGVNRLYSACYEVVSEVLPKG
jgi:hypothetical protein